MVLARHRIDEMPSCTKPAVVALPTPVTFDTSMGPPLASEAAGCRGRIDWVEFDAPRRKRGGETWDHDGSGPDLGYTIAVDERRIYKSPKYEAFAWNHMPEAVTVSSGQSLVIELVDRDLVSADRIGVFQWTVPAKPPAAPVTLVNGRASMKLQVTCSDAS